MASAGFPQLCAPVRVVNQTALQIFNLVNSFQYGVIDCRGLKEFVEWHCAGAAHVDLGNLADFDDVLYSGDRRNAVIVLALPSTQREVALLASTLRSRSRHIDEKKVEAPSGISRMRNMLETVYLLDSNLTHFKDAYPFMCFAANLDLSEPILLEEERKHLSRVFPSHVCHVPLDVWLGGAICSHDENVLKALGIDTVVNVSAECRNHFENTGTPQRQTTFTCHYERIGIEDSTEQDLTAAFNSFFQIMDIAVRRKHRVLVHCAQGKSRSVSMIVAWIMRQAATGQAPGDQLSTDKTLSLYARSLRLVQDARPIAQPNEYFARQLQRLEVDLCTQKTVIQA